MPPVALAPSSREARLAAATERWTALLNAQPDLEPAISLQRDLVAIVVDFIDTLEERPRPRLSLPPRYLAAKLSKGIPALAAEPIPVPTNILKPGLIALCKAMSRGGAGEVADRIAAAVDAGTLDAGSLLSASLARNPDVIRTGAAHRGLAPDLVWLAAELAISPLAHLLQRALLTVDDESLRTAFCAYAWELTVYSCIYCAEEGEAFVTAAPDTERKDRRVEVCGSCGGYLKAVDVPALSPFPLLAISDLETMDLDAAAMEHGYARPTLRDFTTKPQ
jgi:formate dehydrogenase maturation protein FdhE